MDELIHHCLRELSFDGDLGCSVSRLRDFIVGFYTVDATHPQTIDDPFCAFVWSLIVQQPTVRVGIIPPGSATEVYIATQASVKRKAEAKGEQIVEEQMSTLDVVPDAANRSLDDLKTQYGDGLRIAVDPDTSFAAITGSHLRPSKLSPMVYTALQFITRGREQGISVVDLGKKTKYDQKTCFYLVKQLLDLDLIVKKKKSGVGTNFVIHKYFYERDLSWQQIRNEEAQAEGTPEVEPQLPDDPQNSEGDSKVTVTFDPIDTRHLSSLLLVRGRIVKLLKASQNNMHSSTNLLVAIGFPNPTRTDRRFFQTRLRELVAAGIVERVSVLRKRRGASTHTKCIRLLSPDGNGTVEGNDVIIEPQTSADDGKDISFEDSLTDDSGLKMNLTIHKQISDLLEEAGTRGMTLIELSDSLCKFDKRTIELLLTRAERNQPPPHLGDLGTAEIMETFGRERRHRYYTVAAFRTLAAREGFSDSATSYADIDYSAIGGFASISPDTFYEDEETLVIYADSFKDKLNAGSRTYKLKNPVMPDGSVKIGRPRKEQKKGKRKATATGAGVKAGHKRKRGEGDQEDADGREANDEASVKPRRGRPPKKPRLDADAGPKTADQTQIQRVGEEGRTQANSPKKRGRPPKKKPSDSVQDTGHARVDQHTNPEEGMGSPTTPKKRDRSPKQGPESADQPTADSTQQIAGEDGEAMSTSEDAPPQKRGRLTKQRETSPPCTVESDEPPAQSSIIEAERITPPIDTNLSPGVGIFLGENITAGSSHFEPEARRSSRKRKPVVRDDNSVPTKQTPGRKPVVSKTAKTATRTINEPASVGNRGTSVLPVELSQDRMSNPSANLASSDAPQQISESQLAVPSSDVQNLTAASAPVDPVLTMDENVSRSNMSSNSSQLGKPVDEVAQSQQAPARSKVNVSQLRRENELVRVIEIFGGMINTHTKEFFETHMNLVETMTQAGEPTSAPIGTRLDKRTAETTLNSMATRGRIRILKTSLLTSTGATRPASIVYLPSIDQDALNSFLVDLGRSYSSPMTHFPPVNRIDEPLNYGSTQVQRAALPLQLLQMEEHSGDDTERWSRNTARAAQLFTFDDATIREVLLAERTTLGQLYGFIVGKAMRARFLHLITLGFFDRQVSSPRIISLEHRILDLSFFYHDLQLSSFCSLIGSLVHDEELDQFLQTPEGRETPVEKIPVNIHTSLQVGRARTRSRFLDLLEFLRSLGLVAPLRASDSSSPQYTTGPNGDHPTAFDVASLEGWSSTASFNAPPYWRFNECAPLHFWSLSETSPPFWKDMPIVSCHDAVTYWHDLGQACRNRDLPQKTPGPSVGNVTESVTGPLSPNIGVARSLRREVSWNGSYILTWHQEQYLHRFVDRTTGDTPIQDEDAGEAQLQKICWVVSAPRDVVEKYFGKARKKITKELDKVRQKTKRQVADEEARKATEAKALLQRKAAEAKAQREKDWDEMLLRVHQEPLKGSAAVRMRRVRTRFLQSSTGSDAQKWEGEITQAIREVKMAAKEVLPKKGPQCSQPAPASARVAPPPLVSNHPEKSVEGLIAQQSPLRTVKEPTKRKSREKGDTQESPSEVKPRPPARRGRFQWNRDYDELARDASVIIRARCRDGPRLDWGALEQVFPAVPRNSVRQRIVTLKEVPGAEAYLKRLEDRWYDLWSQHRGTENLPDDDPRSPSNFNLVRHVEFLRRHIDKNAIRVGFAVQTSHVKLPASVDDVARDWEIVEKSNTGPVWEFHWNALVDEGREKNLLKHPFTAHASDIPLPKDVSAETVYLAESVVKMVFGAPNENYDPEAASRLLHSIGEEPTSVATANLLSRGVLSKSMRDPKHNKPGRTLKISEVNQNALGGSISRDTFQHASAFEDIIPNQGDNWQQWPLLATDGDTAALIQFVSEDKVELRIDTSQAQAARPSLDWNSKKADDDQIETLLSVRFHNFDDPAPELQSSEASPSASHMELDAETSSTHGVTVDGQIACCKRESDGLIDCLCCLEVELLTFLIILDPGDADLVQHIMTTVRGAAAEGVSKDQLLASVKGPIERVLALVHRMTELSNPLLFWAGYASSVLVSSMYLQNWTVLISQSPRTRIFPRRWFDLAGKQVQDVWESALKAVVGVVAFRPGVSQTELRWRLRPVYDRQEVHDVLRYLQQEGILKRRWNPELRLEEQEEMGHLLALDEMEEKNAFWFIGGSKHWYQV